MPDFMRAMADRAAAHADKVQAEIEAEHKTFRDPAWDASAGAPLPSPTKFELSVTNRYRGPRDSIAMHSDKEKELQPGRPIESLSAGAVREFKMLHVAGRYASLRIKLQPGSALIMGGNCQRYWTHGIDKSDTECGVRYNTTFRMYKHG